MARANPPLSSQLLRQVIRGVDARLRRSIGIVEFDRSDDALVRIAVARADREIELSDGTRLRPGEPVLELHLWNEHLQPLPPEGPTLRWAVATRRQLARSLARLAAYVLAAPELDGVKALCMKPAFGSRSLARDLGWLVAKHGFESLAERGKPARRYDMHRWLDSFWLWLLTWAFNPLSLRGRRFRRTRQEFWTSRARFVALFGPPGEAAPASSPVLAQSIGARPLAE
jgi:hypothetical protein